MYQNESERKKKNKSAQLGEVNYHHQKYQMREHQYDRKRCNYAHEIYE